MNALAAVLHARYPLSFPLDASADAVEAYTNLMLSGSLQPTVDPDAVCFVRERQRARCVGYGLAGLWVPTRERGQA